MARRERCACVSSQRLRTILDCVLWTAALAAVVTAIVCAGDGSARAQRLCKNDAGVTPGWLAAMGVAGLFLYPCALELLSLLLRWLCCCGRGGLALGDGVGGDGDMHGAAGGEADALTGSGRGRGRAGNASSSAAAASASAASASKLPVVYHARYNITAGGLERMHPFDSEKYSRVHAMLTTAGGLAHLDVDGDADADADGLRAGGGGEGEGEGAAASASASAPTATSSARVPLIDPRRITAPAGMPTDAELRLVHTWWHLFATRFSCVLTTFLEVPVCCLPTWILRWRVLEPMLWQTSGTMLAAELALAQGWAINLGGGFHHAHAGWGGGFCVYSDIALAVRHLRRRHPMQARRVMIVDLDAHQGNGHERDFRADDDTYVLDAYNPYIYPGDLFARDAIDSTIHFTAGDDGRVFLRQLGTALDDAMARFRPDLVVYNAGTDCLEGDPLGGLSLTADAICERDAMVFERCLRRPGGARPVPIVMVLSGGYLPNNAEVIALSLARLDRRLGLFSGRRPKAT